MTIHDDTTHGDSSQVRDAIKTTSICVTWSLGVGTAVLSFWWRSIVGKHRTLEGKSILRFYDGTKAISIYIVPCTLYARIVCWMPSYYKKTTSGHAHYRPCTGMHVLHSTCTWESFALFVWKHGVLTKKEYECLCTMIGHGSSKSCQTKILVQSNGCTKPR